MLPFDRLIRLTDQWAADHPDEDLYAQIGGGTYEPRHMRWARLLSRQDFAELVTDAKLIVGHAGIGTIVMAQEMSKPVLVLPRRFDLQEHTNDHQLHTAKWLADKEGIFIATTDEDLRRTLTVLAKQDLAVTSSLGSVAPSGFTSRIRAFLIDG